MQLRIAGVIKESVVDGPGLRYVVFAQGCHKGCKGCHNPDTQDLDGGYLVETDELIKDIQGSKHTRGITFSGGEPFLQGEAFIQIARAIKTMGKDLVIYTGYTWEELLDGPGKEGRLEVLRYTDFLVDGPFIEGERDFGLPFRGSRNQRVIDVQLSLAQGKIVKAVWG